MREYLIRRADGEWFDLKYTEFLETLKANSFPSEGIEDEGDHCIQFVYDELRS